MKSSTRDETEGKWRQAKGKAKEVIGKASNNPELEAEGKVEKFGGKAQEKTGDMKKIFKK